MADKKSLSWGGRRSNAGRKPSGKKYKTVSICGSEHEIDSLKKQAAARDKTLSRYVIDELLDKPDE